MCIRDSFSVDSTNHKDGRKPSDAVVERLLRMRIRWSSTFICLIGPKTHTREWVNDEIKWAHEQGKKIVGVYTCLLYTSDAADERSSVDLGGCSNIKKKKMR